MNKVDVELGQLVRKYRTQADLTQLELAKKLGYDSMQFVSLFERGLSKIPHKVIGKLVTILGIPERKCTRLLMTEFRRQLIEDVNDGKKVNKI